MSEPLNVVYMHSHDTGRHIAPYGYPVHTPNSQRFAEQGVVFRNAFCAGPTCSPSRAGLLTGAWPHQVGMLGLAHRGFSLGDYGKTWFNSFRDAGYQTVLAGLEHVGLRRHAKGGQVHDIDLQPRSMSGRHVIPKTLDYLAQQHGQPFFLDIGLSETHRTGKSGSGVQWHNGNASPIGDPRYVRPPVTLPDTPDTRQDIADFNECVTRLDHDYGHVLEALDDHGLADRTIAIITTDHGIAFPGMKCSLTDHGMGVLLMMRGPAELGLAGGKVIDAMVSHVDIYPTLCELLGMPTPGHVQGKSIRPLLDGSIDAEAPDALNDAVFSQVTYHAAYEPKRAVRTARYKYIRYFHGGNNVVAANIDDSVSKTHMAESGYIAKSSHEEQLFDLVFDPIESCNLADDPAHAEALAEMRTRLDDWMKQTDDPLMAGPIPLPEGGVINRHTDVSPGDETLKSNQFDPAHP